MGRGQIDFTTGQRVRVMRPHAWKHLEREAGTIITISNAEDGRITLSVMMDNPEVIEGMKNDYGPLVGFVVPFYPEELDLL